MESDFIGSHILVTLLYPPNAQVRGIVLHLHSGQLVLRNVYWLASGHSTPHFAIASNNIKDLQVLAEEPPATVVQPTPLTQHIPRQSISPQQYDNSESLPESLRGSISFQSNAPTTHTVEAPTSHPATISAPAASQPFVDPAIVSMARPPPNAISIPADSNVSKPRSPMKTKPPIPRQMLVEADRSSPTRATPAVPPTITTRLYRASSVASATLSQPFDELSLDKSHEDESEAAELGTDGGMGDYRQAPAIQSSKRPKRRTKGTRNGADAILPTHVEEIDSPPAVSRKGPARARAAREAPQPLVSEMSGMELNGSMKTKKKKSSRRDRNLAKQKAADMKSGWATEDATDIQELGDFDFQGNLSKFDKREIFRQLKEDDTMPAEQRLVGHNRVPKPGTAGGKNLHWTENVLDAPHVLSAAVASTNPGLAAPKTDATTSKWLSEAGDSDDYDDADHSDAVVSSERGSRRAHSRASIFRNISRKSSGRGDATTSNPTATPPTTITLNTASFASVNAASTRSPSFNTAMSPRTRKPSSPYINSAAGFPRTKLKVEGSKRSVPTLGPLQTLEMEQLATSKLGLSEDVLSENAARGVAEAVIRMVRTGKRAGLFSPSPNADNDNENDTSGNGGAISLFVAAGNHRNGARTLAAARHLRNKGFLVTAAVMERNEDEYTSAVRSQGNALKKVGGNIIKPDTMLARVKAGEGDVLLEALLGVHKKFADLRGEEQAWFFEMCMVVGNGRLSTGSFKEVVSVDVPSGVDAVSGELTQVDPPASSPTIMPTAIISLCAPKPFLAVTPPLDLEISLFVVDIGIGNDGWRRLGNRRTNKGIDWGDEWVKTITIVNSE